MKLSSLAATDNVDKPALIELLRTLSTKLGAYHPMKLTIEKVVPRSFPLLSRSTVTDVELLVKGRHAQPIKLTLVQGTEDDSHHPELLTSNVDTLARAFARESGEADLREALQREDVATLAHVLGDAVRLHVVPPEVWLAPEEGVIYEASDGESWFPKEASDGTKRFPADRPGFERLLQSIRGPHWNEHDQFVFSRMDIVHGHFDIVLLVIRDFVFAFNGKNSIAITENHRDFVEILYDFKDPTKPSDDVASVALQAPSSATAIQIPDLSKDAQARFDKRWEWLIPHLVSRDAVSFAFRVDPPPTPAEPATEIDEQRARLLADAWRQRLELPSSGIEHSLQLADRVVAADRAHRESGESDGRFAGMRLLCPFSLRLLVELYFGEWPESRSWSGLLGPTNLTRVTRNPKAIAELLTTEPYWSLMSEASLSPVLLTLLSATFEPTPLVKNPDSNGVLERYTLDNMDRSDNDRVWIPQDTNAWRYLRQHIVEPRIFTEPHATGTLGNRIVRVDYVYAEMVERREHRLALVDFDRHELKVDRQTGSIEGRISLLAPLVCIEPTRPVIGRPFIVDGALVTAKPIKRGDW